MSARESIENPWDRATPVAPLLDARRAEVLLDAAAFVEFWHGQAPDVFSPLDSAALLRHIAGGGNPKDTPYP